MALRDKPPAGFINLLEAEMKPALSTVSVMGVLVDFMPTVQSRGSDFSTIFGLLDPESKTHYNTESGCKTRFFDKTIDEAPRFTGRGDVVLLRRIRRSGNPSCVLIKNYSTQIIVFPAAILAACTKGGPRQDKGMIDLDRLILGKGAAKPTPEEIAYAQFLYGWKSGNLDITDPLSETQIVQPLTTMALKDKFKLLQDARDSTYVDIIGEVVKIFPAQVPELYVTDYTENKDFYPYSKSDAVAPGEDGDPFGYTRKGWQGPSGKYTFLISLWPPHSTWVIQPGNLHERDTVLIRNVHIKTSPSNGFLEGKLHQDPKRPNEINIRKYHSNNDERFLNFVARRKAYQESILGQKKVGKIPQKKSRQQKKKERKRQQRAIQEKGEASANNHVACNNPNFPTTSFSYILNDENRRYTTPKGIDLTLPFINRKCKIRARVVDYFPHHLQDFTSSLEDQDYNDLQKSQGSVDVTLDLMSSNHKNPWEWAFFLLLEDAQGPPPPVGQNRPRLRVVVPHQDAEFLLKLQACDLRRDSEALDALRQKMFILWGDLEEIKTAREFGTKKSSSRAFDCWVSEFGIPKPDGGWERMFKLGQTTIR